MAKKDAVLADGFYLRHKRIGTSSKTSGHCNGEWWFGLSRFWPRMLGAATVGPLMRWLGDLFGLLAISAASATEQQTLRQLSEARILGFLVLSGCIVEASEHGAMGHYRRLYVRQCVEAKPAPPTAPTR